MVLICRHPSNTKEFLPIPWILLLQRFRNIRTVFLASKTFCKATQPTSEIRLCERSSETMVGFAAIPVQMISTWFPGGEHPNIQTTLQPSTQQSWKTHLIMQKANFALNKSSHMEWYNWWSGTHDFKYISELMGGISSFVFLLNVPNFWYFQIMLITFLSVIKLDDKFSSERVKAVDSTADKDKQSERFMP